jgi:hypothetical protein
MVVKELTASAYHVRRLFERNDYIRRFTVVVQNFSSESTKIQPNFSGVIGDLQALQNVVIEYEAQTGFPFDSNPLLSTLNIDSYVGIGALENLMDLVRDDPGEAQGLLQVSQNKLQVANSIIEKLMGGLAELPAYDDAKLMYAVDPNRVVVRFVLPYEQNHTLDASAKSSTELVNALKHLGKLDKDREAYRFNVITISHSSPEEILLTIGINGALALNLIVLTILKRWKEVEEIRLIRARAENVSADTELKKVHKEKILQELSEFEASMEEDNAHVAKKVVEQFGENLDGERPEVEGAVKESVNYIENLTINGGAVNIYIRPSRDGNMGVHSDRKLLIESRKMQVKLEASRKLLDNPDK